MPSQSNSRKLTVPPMPTAAEVDILAVLWRLGPATVREVHEALDKDSGYNTTLKQMQLMTEKGLLVRTERFARTSTSPPCLRTICRNASRETC